MKLGIILLAVAGVFGGILVLANRQPRADTPRPQELTASVSQETNEASTKEETEETEAEERASLAIADYLLPLENSKPRTEDISHVVLHFISNGAVKPENPYAVEDIYDIFKEYGLSTHYLVDREGALHRFVQEDRVAYHAGTGELPGFPGSKNQLNSHSIGIEILAIGTKEEMAGMIPPETYEKLAAQDIGYTKKQYEALNELLEDIIRRNPNVQKDRNHIVGHEEYAPGRKTDPGSLFDWSRLAL